MTFARRTLGLLAALGIVPLPACLFVQGTLPPAKRTATPVPAETNDSPNQTQFAVYPSRPGERVAKHSESQPADPTPVQHQPDTQPVNTQPPFIPGDPQKFLLTSASLPDPPLVVALRSLLENRPEQAIEALKPLDKANQDFAMLLLSALAHGAQLNLAKADPQELAVISEQLQTAAGRLEPRAALRVDKIAFCRHVYGFGRFDPRPEGAPFQPNDIAEMYVEVRHASIEPTARANEGEGFESRIVSALEIRDAAGRIVEQVDPADYRQRVQIARLEHKEFIRSAARDRYVYRRFPVPPIPGRYTVTVEITDPVGGPRTTRSVPVEFRVGGP